MFYFTCSIYKRTHPVTEHPLSTSDDNQALLFIQRKDGCGFLVLQASIEPGLQKQFLRIAPNAIRPRLWTVFSKHVLITQPTKQYCSTGNERMINSELQLRIGHCSRSSNCKFLSSDSNSLPGKVLF